MIFLAKLYMWKVQRFIQHRKVDFDLFSPSSWILLAWFWTSCLSHYSKFRCVNLPVIIAHYLLICVSFFSTGINEQETIAHPHVPGLSQDLYHLVMIKSTGLVGNHSVPTEMVRVPMTRSTIFQIKDQVGWGTMMSAHMMMTTVLTIREILSLCARK